MPRYLTFHLYAPLGAFGDVAPGEVRGTDLTPSRSAILGLLAAALGVNREDPRLFQLRDELGMAFRTHLGNDTLRDYQTIHTPNTGSAKIKPLQISRKHQLAAFKIETTISPRTYLQDPVITAAVWSRKDEPQTLKDLQAALKRPKWSLYLGRRNCTLAHPIDPRIVEADTIEAVFSENPVPEHLASLCQNDPILTWDADAKTNLKPARTIQRRDHVLPKRRFQIRTEYMATSFTGDQE